MEEIGQKIFQQAMDIWIVPEIERRKKDNRLPDNFELRQAQIVFSPERGFNKVRLNKEVKARYKCSINVAKKTDEPVYEHEIKGISAIELTEADPNCGHITLILIKDSWNIGFDFRYNKKRIKEHIDAAKEFFQSAKANLEKGRLRPFYEEAFACAELAAKAVLIQLPDKEFLYGKDHKSRIEKFQNWANLGNVKVEHSSTLRRLYALRASARYLSSTEFVNEDPKEFVRILEEMIDFAEIRTK